MGSERGTVSRLSDPRPNGILQVFTLPSLPGRVYVECEGIQYVQAAFPHSRSILHIPADEYDDCIRWSSSKDPPNCRWVRFRRGPIKGDLAIMLRLQTADIMTVAMVPCIALNDPKAGKQRKKPRIPAALFAPEAVRAVYGPRSVTKLNDSFRFRNQTYVNGLCVSDIQATHAVTTEHHPSLQELFPFFESGMEAIKTTLMDTLKRESIRDTWQCGDRVEILEGAFATHFGRLLSLDLNLWSAEVAVEAVPAESEHSKQGVSLDGLRRFLMNGDSVLVVAGRSVGRRGLVVQVESLNVSFVEDTTRQEVSFQGINYIRRSNPLHTGHSATSFCEILFSRLHICLTANVRLTAAVVIYARDLLWPESANRQAHHPDQGCLQRVVRLYNGDWSLCPSGSWISATMPQLPQKRSCSFVSFVHRFRPCLLPCADE